MKQHRHDRRYYLEDIPLDEALKKFHDALDKAGAIRPSPGETVPLERANGRVTAEAIWAKVSSPHYDAGRDGRRSSEIEGHRRGDRDLACRLKVGEQAVWLDTGDPVPEGFDAVVMIEVVHEVDESTIEVRSPVPPYEHVRALGEDIVATELVLPENHKLRPQDLAACGAAGLSEVSVRRPPKVAIIRQAPSWSSSAPRRPPGRSSSPTP